MTASEKTASASPPQTRAPMTRTETALYGLLGLAIMYTLYFAKSLLMPIVVASLFALLLSPLVEWFKKLYVPRTISAVLLLTAIGGALTLLTMELTEPAQKWSTRLPELSEKITEQLDSLEESVAPQNKPQADQSNWFSFFGRAEEPPQPAENTNTLTQRVKQGGMELLVSVLSATPLVIGQFLTFVILVLFLLIFGPGLYSSCMQFLPRIKDRKRAVVLVNRIQQELSRYILTVSLINAGLGIVTGIILGLMGFEDAMLWGTLVGLLNFAPYIGPLISFCILSVAGVVQYGWDMAALLPVAVYFGINLCEAQFVTPLVLGRNMRLNPLMLILWLMLWGWLWGAVGVLLAVPLLVCLKLAAAQLNILPSWVQLVETRA